MKFLGKSQGMLLDHMIRVLSFVRSSLLTSLSSMMFESFLKKLTHFNILKIYSYIAYNRKVIFLLVLLRYS